MYGNLICYRKKKVQVVQTALLMERGTSPAPPEKPSLSASATVTKTAASLNLRREGVLVRIFSLLSFKLHNRIILKHTPYTKWYFFILKQYICFSVWQYRLSINHWRRATLVQPWGYEASVWEESWDSGAPQLLLLRCHPLRHVFVHWGFRFDPASTQRQGWHCGVRWGTKGAEGRDSESFESVSWCFYLRKWHNILLERN